MVVLTAETCWALNEYWIYNKISGIKLVSLLPSYSCRRLKFYTQFSSPPTALTAGLIPQSPASGAGNVSQPRLMSQIGRVRSHVHVDQCFCSQRGGGRVQLKRDGTRWRTGGEAKGKLANGVGSQYPSHHLGTWCIQYYYRWCAHLGWQ